MIGDAARWERIQALFHAALELPEIHRRAFLENECGEDAALSSDVLALLAEDARGSTLLEGDLVDVAHDVLDGPVPVPRTIGRHRVLGRLGQGGMGVVYLAEREDLAARVAIKMLRDASLSPARRERFATEQRTLAQLNHPNIARLYDADVAADGTPYFVMEHVEGVPLTTYCSARGSSIAELLRLFRAACEAVQFAHRHAIIHRDLKPSNIMVTADGVVKLLDFGISKQLESLDAPADPTQTGLRLMTPAYAAPEQMRGEPVGVYTDVYALGVVLYELLTGALPFDLSRLTPGQAETTILEREPEKPSVAAGPSAVAVARSAWKDLDVLCLTAMHKDPQRRYRTVEALVRDIDHFLKAEPLDARPDTLGYRAGKFLRRNSRPVAAAALVVAAVISLVTIYTLQLTEQRNRAQTEAAKAGKLSEYLIGLFEASDPYTSDADDVDVRTLLERGEQRAEELASEPAVHAQMLDVLGRVYIMLSDYDRAEALLTRALTLRRALRDAPLDVAETLMNVGNLRVHTGEYESAELALREALAIREQHLPSDDADVATTLDELGVILGGKGEYQAAVEVLLRGLRIRETIYDGAHADLGSSYNNLAVNLYYLGDNTSAERYYRQALSVDSVVYGPDHPSLATDLANLGKLFENRGDLAEAERLLTDALRIRRAALGEAHFETAMSLNQLGGTLQLKGDFDAAERHIREALAIREHILGPDDPGVATSVNGLGLILQLREDFDAAESMFRRAADIYRSALGARHRYTGIALCNLGSVLTLEGEVEAAQRIFRDCIDIMQEVHPPGHPELAYNTSRFGALLAAQSRYVEAEPLLRESHEALDSHYGADHQRTREAAKRLLDLYVAWNRPEQADSIRQIPGLASQSLKSTPIVR
jgi:tetratricopeptide (TPR) repeat protein/tRNA A-37 threonylcarbamoyl transferase component Bud32